MVLVVGKEGNLKVVVYLVLKVGVIGLIKLFGKEFVSYDIVVNCVIFVVVCMCIFD